jgi:hypothetical protein
MADVGVPDFPGHHNPNCDTGFQPVPVTVRLSVGAIRQQQYLKHGPEARVTIKSLAKLTASMSPRKSGHAHHRGVYLSL